MRRDADADAHRDRDARLSTRDRAPPTRRRKHHAELRSRARRRAVARARSPTSRSLPAASKCVRGRKLTVRFKKPPKGYSVKTITVRVNSKKVATIKGAKLKKPLYLRKLPNGSFTVTVSITLKKGKGLTERRRYTACK